MTRFGWFKRRPEPPAAPSISRHDAEAARAAGLILTEWMALTDQERAERRWNLTRATNFNTMGHHEHRM